MRATIAALLLAHAVLAGEPVAPWESGKTEPDWGKVEPVGTIDLVRDEALDDVENGRLLHEVLHGLQAGTRLRIGPGTWSMSARTSLCLRGTPEAPIFVEALDSDAPPTLTRPDASQNVLNLGDASPARYVVFRGLRITGGSTLFRVYDGSHIWLDACELFEGGGEGVVANTHDTVGLFITRNHIHDFKAEQATGEGMYLGNHNGNGCMSYSVVAFNHVHDCAGTQGDGIEVKQGSHHNWIVGNEVHNTQYPCLTVYGTGGNGINVIENNVCYRSGDNVAQIQGEAVVRNNLFLAGEGAGLRVRDHVARTTNLVVVHNTIINVGTGVRYDSWAGRDGMVFANNAVFTRDGPALDWRSHQRGGHLDGNVVSGRIRGVYTGYRDGRGLQDFVDVSWDAGCRDATPAESSSLLSRAVREWRLDKDQRGTPRPVKASAGALERVG